ILKKIKQKNMSTEVIRMENKELKNELLKDPFKSIDDNDDELVLQPQKETSQNSNSSSVLTTYQDQYSEDDLKTIQDIKNKIEQIDNAALITEGANAQQSMSKCTHQMLSEVKTKEVGPIRETLQELMKKLKDIKPDELTNEKSNIFKRLFGKVKRSVNEMISKHQSIASQVDRISIQLEHAKEVLVKDVNMLDGLYEQNKDYFDAINIYIAADRSEEH